MARHFDDSLFLPIAYELDFERIHSFALEDEASRVHTVGEALTALLPHRFQWNKETKRYAPRDAAQECVVESTTGCLTVTAGSLSHSFDGIRKSQQFAMDFLQALLALDQKLGDRRWPTFYFYDSDFVRDDPGFRCYTFFAVSDDSIVVEDFSLTSFRDFDPAVLKKGYEGDVWRSEKARRRAVAAHWYRRFYTETRIGKLMALRTDVEHHNFEPDWRRDAELGMLLRTLSSRQRATNWLLGTVAILLTVALFK